MDVIFHKNFIKAYDKLSPKQRDKVDEAILLFRSDPHHTRLNNHALHGDLKGRRAISAGGDLRLIFREFNNYHTVLFQRVGSHNRVY